MEASSKTKKILRSFPQEVQDYFWKLDKRLAKKKFKLIVSSGLSVNLNGGRCSGYYDERNKVLKVALGKGWEHSFGVCIHEASHHIQATNKSSIWHTKIGKNHTKFFEWLGGKNFRNPRLLATCAMALEKDCERRAAAEIRKKYSHLLNPESYCIKANAYLASYFWQFSHRSWLKKTPYNRKLMAHCPPKLFRDFSEISETLELAMERYL